MSIWKQEHVPERIIESLENLNATGYNFVTAYQLAIQFAKDHGEVVDKLAIPIGGKDSGVKKSLASYLAGEIAKRKKVGEMADVDMAFLLTTWIQDIQFKYDNDDSFLSSVTGKKQTISVFRLNS